MSCAYVSVFVLVLTASVCRLGLGAPRLPRQLTGAGEHKVFVWDQGYMLSMQNNGTVQLKPARDHNCNECAVDLPCLCRHYNVSGCPKLRLELKKNDRLSTTIVLMRFFSAGKYLCMHRNATFYAVDVPNADQLEECAFYVVTQKKTGGVFIYHFKYPEKKRNCRLAERRKGRRKLCVKYYLRKGNGRSLKAFKGRFLKQSRWIHRKKDLEKQDV